MLTIFIGLLLIFAAFSGWGKLPKSARNAGKISDSITQRLVK